MPADGFRYELVRGELKKIPPAGDEHGYIAERCLRSSGTMSRPGTSAGLTPPRRGL
jgi:hypothetical protein